MWIYTSRIRYRNDKRLSNTSQGTSTTIWLFVRELSMRLTNERYWGGRSSDKCEIVIGTRYRDQSRGTLLFIDLPRRSDCCQVNHLCVWRMRDTDWKTCSVTKGEIMMKDVRCWARGPLLGVFEGLRAEVSIRDASDECSCCFSHSLVPCLLLLLTLFARLDLHWLLVVCCSPYLILRFALARLSLRGISGLLYHLVPSPRVVLSEVLLICVLFCIV